MSSAGTAATFAITDTKLYVPIVTIKMEDNTKLSKLFQWLNKLYVFAYTHGDNVTDKNSCRKYFLSRLKIKIYNI